MIGSGNFGVEREAAHSALLPWMTFGPSPAVSAVPAISAIRMDPAMSVSVKNQNVFPTAPRRPVERATHDAQALTRDDRLDGRVLDRSMVETCRRRLPSRPRL